MHRLTNKHLVVVVAPPSLFIQFAMIVIPQSDAFIYSSSNGNTTTRSGRGGRGAPENDNSSGDDKEVLELMDRLDPARFKLSVDVVKVNRPRLPSPGSEMVRMAVVL